MLHIMAKAMNGNGDGLFFPATSKFRMRKCRKYLQCSSAIVFLNLLKNFPMYVERWM